MISLPVSANIDSSNGSSRLHRGIAPPSVRKENEKWTGVCLSMNAVGVGNIFSPHCTLGSALPIWKNQA